MMATGCSNSLQHREAGAGWHLWCRGEQVGEGSRTTAWAGGVLQCWERVLQPALFLAASSQAVPRTSTAGSKDAVRVCRVRSGTLFLSLLLSQGSASAFSSFRCPLVVFCTFQTVFCPTSSAYFGAWDLGLYKRLNALGPCWRPQVPPQVTRWLGDEVPRGDWWLGCVGDKLTLLMPGQGMLGGQNWADWEGVYVQWKHSAEGLANG